MQRSGYIGTPIIIEWNYCCFFALMIFVNLTPQIDQIKKQLSLLKPIKVFKAGTVLGLTFCLLSLLYVPALLLDAAGGLSQGQSALHANLKPSPSFFILSSVIVIAIVLFKATLVGFVAGLLGAFTYNRLLKLSLKFLKPQESIDYTQISRERFILTSEPQESKELVILSTIGANKKT